MYYLISTYPTLHSHLISCNTCFSYPFHKSLLHFSLLCKYKYII